MVRRSKQNPAEGLMDLAARVPWWVGVLLAVISYLALHAYAALPRGLPTPPQAGQRRTVPVAPVFPAGCRSVGVQAQRGGAGAHLRRQPQ